MPHGGGGGGGGHGGGFGGGHGGGFGGGHGGGFGGGHGGFGGGHGGFGGHGFGGHGPGGFGGPGFFGPGWPGPGPGGFFGPPGPGGLLGPGPGIFGPRGPAFAPWLGALAVTAVAASAAAPYTYYNSRRPGRVVWTEEGKEVSAPVNMLTVRLCQAQNLKRVQMLGKQDPYVRAKLYYQGQQIGECRSSTHTDGGKNPVWQNTSKSVFTFYVPATVTLDRLTLTLDIINENMIADNTIGSTGGIKLDQAANGAARWWNVSTGGTIQAIIELVTSDNMNSQPGNAYSTSGASAGRGGAAGGGSSSGGGGYSSTRYPSHPVAVAQARPAPVPAASPYGATGRSSATSTNASMMDPPHGYTGYAAPASSSSSAQYRPPPVAPGAAPGYGTASGKGNPYSEKQGYGAGAGAGAALPEAQAVPVYEGSANDPYNARGAASAAAGAGGGVSAYGGSGASGMYPTVSAYPAPSSAATQQQYPQQQPYSQQQQQQQRHSTNQGYYNGKFGGGR